MIKKTLLIISLFTSASGHASIYQCTVDGQAVFSDTPCGEDSREIEVRAPERSGGGSMVSDRAMEFMDERDRKSSVSRIDRDIDRQKKRKDAARTAMDESLIRYQRRKAYANDNLAGAVWEGSLADEAEVLRKRFQAEIDSADREIDRLRGERRRILNR